MQRHEHYSAMPCECEAHLWKTPSQSGIIFSIQPLHFPQIQSRRIQGETQERRQMETPGTREAQRFVKEYVKIRVNPRRRKLTSPKRLAARGASAIRIKARIPACCKCVSYQGTYSCLPQVRLVSGHAFMRVISAFRIRPRIHACHKRDSYQGTHSCVP